MQTAMQPAKTTMCPEFKQMLWQRQSHATNCVPTAMRMVLNAKGQVMTVVPDAPQQGLRDSDANMYAMGGGFKIVDASEFQQNLPKAANAYTAMIRKNSFIAIHSFAHGALGSATRDYNHAVVIVGITELPLGKGWVVHYYDPGASGQKWKEVQHKDLGDFAALVEEWWVPDWK
jgi:hypothetical protein